MSTGMPPGPALPALLQTALFLLRPHSFLRRCQLRHGDVFTLRLVSPDDVLPGPIVYLADPAAIKDLFAMDGVDGHAGAANKVLEPLAGANSILLLDGDRHLAERRLLSPAFHGDALRRLDAIIRQATERELESWSADSVFALRPAMQRITFEVITRAVLGIDDPALRRRLLKAFEPLFNVSITQALGYMPAIRVDLGPLTPWGRFQHKLRELDRVLLDLIAERRRSEPREDVLGLLLAATDQRGKPLPDRHIRDEVVTLLLAGHETTATALAWAFERLAHHPDVVSRLRLELAQGNEDALDPVAAEVLRVRPVVMDVARRVCSDIELAGYRIPAGTTVMPAIYLVHLDPKNFERPEELDPGRAPSGRPGNLTWLPFGGGRRRCLGAAFAQMEMRIVLSTILRSFVPGPSSSRPERARLRGVTFVPEHGARVHMRRIPLLHDLELADGIPEPVEVD